MITWILFVLYLNGEAEYIKYNSEKECLNFLEDRITKEHKKDVRMIKEIFCYNKNL